MSTPLEAVVAEAVAIASGADAAALHPHAKLHEIGIDSLSLVTVAALVEAESGIALDDDAAARLFDVRSLAELTALFALAAGEH